MSRPVRIPKDAERKLGRVIQVIRFHERGIVATRSPTNMDDIRTCLASQVACEIGMQMMKALTEKSDTEIINIVEESVRNQNDPVKADFATSLAISGITRRPDDPTDNIGGLYA